MALGDQLVAAALLAASVGCLAVYALLHGNYLRRYMLAWQRSERKGKGGRRSSRVCPARPCKQACRTLSWCFGAGLREDNSIDLFAAKAHAIALQRGAEYARVACSTMIHIVALHMVSDLALGTFQDLVEVASGEDELLVHYSLNYYLFVRRTSIFIIALAINLLPDWVTPRALQVFQIVIASQVAMRALMQDSIIRLRSNEAVDTALCIWAAVFAGGPRLTSLLVVSTLLLRYYLYTSLLAMADSEQQEYLASLYGADHTRHYMAGHAIAGGVTILVGSTLERSILEGAMGSLRERISAQIKDLVQQLLAALCDSVVRTDGDFALLDPSLSLASLLLRQPPGKTYKGHSFLDFVDEPERSRVRNHFVRSLGALGVTQSIHTRLVDGNGLKCNVQLYRIAFQDIHGRSCNIIGIRDEGGSRLDGVSVQSVTEKFEAYRSKERKRSSRCESKSSASSSSCSSSTVESTESSTSAPLSSMSTTNDGDVAEAYLDIQEMTVVTWNPAFSMFCGPEQEPCVPLHEWLLPPQTEKVPQAIRRLCQSFLAEENREGRGRLVQFGRLVLQPPHAQRAGVKYQVQLYVDTRSLAIQSQSNAACFVRLEFKDIAVADMRRPRPPSSRAPGTPGSSSGTLQNSPGLGL
eukprot:TRINITY_DN51332_c0_g1_i1.p1 TRINITY_DN51332_c0_g1~~TRINITY_DN51332_c0_g1_i1.p1  ORF type:complete len:638 (+),score=79.40 TRINITY_DN51332_c0_g1_i1:91-2004(+)